MKISRSRSSSTPSSSDARRRRSSRARAASASSAERGVEAGAAAQRVDRLEAAGRHQPGARIGGHAVARPLLERRGEGVVQRLLGAVEVAEQADQRREHAARLGAVDGVEPSPWPRGRVLRPCGVVLDRHALELHDRPHLDRCRSCADGILRGDLDRVVQVLARRSGRSRRAAPSSRQTGRRWSRPCPLRTRTVVAVCDRLQRLAGQVVAALA